jgi:hypothetical protein
MFLRLPVGQKCLRSEKIPGLLMMAGKSGIKPELEICAKEALRCKRLFEARLKKRYCQ